MDSTTFEIVVKRTKTSNWEDKHTEHSESKAIALAKFVKGFCPKWKIRVEKRSSETIFEA